MTVSNHNVIDFVGRTHDDHVLLVMVEERAWGTQGELLRDVEKKLSAYRAYVASGKLAADHPEFVGKPIHIRLMCLYQPTEREIRFLEEMEQRVLGPSGVSLSWSLLGKPEKNGDERG